MLPLSDNKLKKWYQRAVLTYERHRFLFEELVKRDFKSKYKGTVLGMFWSVLFPLMHLLVMRVVFTQFFGRSTPHYTSYLFCGLLVFDYYRESTSSGMTAIMANAGIIGKVKVPNYLFLLSKNVSCLINFCLTFLVFFLFLALDHVAFTWRFLALIYPILCMIVFNIGVGMILSALYVFFRDMTYLYSIFILLLRYLSAIFYNVNTINPTYQKLFLLNPVYCYIKYFRVVCLDGNIPSVNYHLLCACYALVALVIGMFTYKHNRHKFPYYI